MTSSRGEICKAGFQQAVTVGVLEEFTCGWVILSPNRDTSSSSVRSVLSALAWSFTELLPHHYQMPDRACPDCCSGAKQDSSSIHGSLEAGEKTGTIRQFLWSMFVIKWHQEVLQDFLFKDLITSYLLFCHVLSPFPFNHAKKNHDFLFPPLLQWM